MFTLADVATVPKYACSSTACAGWANGATDIPTKELFKDLQRTLNSALKAIGAKTITVDGLIGSGTVAAYAKVRAQLSTLPAMPTKEAMAFHAYLVMVSLDKALPFLRKETPNPPPPPAISLEDLQIPQQPPQLPASASAKIFLQKNKTYLVIGLGVLAVGAAWLYVGDDKKQR